MRSIVFRNATAMWGRTSAGHPATNARPWMLNRQPQRDLNLLEYQAKGLLQKYKVTVQDFRVASSANEAEDIAKQFPCQEYVIKAQVLAGGRGKGHFDNGFKVTIKICGR